MAEQIILLSSEETARLLRVSPKTLERWRSEGTGPRFVRVGRKPLYRTAAVAAWLDAHSAASTSSERFSPRAETNA
jgi:excisionase family DNA binding protein